MNLFNDHSWTPMLLDEIKKPFNNPNYLFEVKFDGIRALVFASPKKVSIYNRHAVEITNLYPELQEIKNLVKKNTIFDGEIVLMKNGKPSFLNLQTRAHLKDNKKINYLSVKEPVVFMAFDLLYEGCNLIDKPLIKRKELLSKYQESLVFDKVFYIMNDGIRLYEEVKKLELEGIVAKEINSKYLINTRCDNWLKIKNWIEERFFIGGFIEKDSLPTISLILGEFKEHKLYYVGKVVMAKKRSLYSKLKKQKNIKNPFIDYSEEANFVKPIYSCVIMYLERTNNNHLRQPIFKEN